MEKGTTQKNIINVSACMFEKYNVVITANGDIRHHHHHNIRSRRIHKPDVRPYVSLRHRGTLK